jgi:peptidoglycan hydrolase-like protein with peptidoglycan-binding domain
VDGVFGLQTEAAVRYFQSAHRLVVDGIIGRETMLMLDREHALDSVDQGAVARDLSAPCHTPVAPGPDDATSSAMDVANVVPRCDAELESTGPSTELGAPVAAPPSPPPVQPRAPDLVV